MSLLNGHVRFSGLPTMAGVLSDRYGVRLNGLREEDARIRLAGLSRLGFAANILGPRAAKPAVIAVGAAITIGTGVLSYLSYHAISGTKSTPWKIFLGVGGTLLALGSLQSLVGTVMAAELLDFVDPVDQVDQEHHQVITQMPAFEQMPALE